MIDGNEYDYDDPVTTTDNVEVAYDWIRNGCVQVAILDAFSLEYLGYMDAEDLPEFKEQLEVQEWD